MQPKEISLAELNGTNKPERKKKVKFEYSEGCFNPSVDLAPGVSIMCHYNNIETWSIGRREQLEDNITKGWR